MRRPAALALVLILLQAGACGTADTGTSLLAGYLQRLSRTLDEPTPPPVMGVTPSILAAELTNIPVPADQIGLLDFLSLSDCDLQRNLGRRNSNLGRTASPSQRLLLDLEFLRLAGPCVDAIAADSPELAQQISAMATARRAALPTLIYNAILAGPEWRAMWRIPATLDDYPAQTSGDIADALGRLANLVEQWIAGDWHADNMAFELLLNELRSGDGGALLLASSQQASYLASANTLLANRTEGHSLCPFGQRTPASQTLENVAARFFAGGVQPWLADLRRRETALMPETLRIERALAAALPANYVIWHSARDETLANLSKAPRQHALSVSALLEDCGGLQGAGGQSATGAAGPR